MLKVTLTKNLGSFLALRCATAAQQSCMYCRHEGVHHQTCFLTTHQADYSGVSLIQPLWFPVKD